jgi:predicted nucleic acid-binding protein
MRQYRLLHLAEETSRTALAWFERFHLSHGVGVLDSLIGATALTHHLILATTHHLILATLNTKHFASFPGLHIERPY